MKTLGQVAYESFYGEDCVPWGESGPEYQQYWERAAQAVIAAYCGRAYEAIDWLARTLNEAYDKLDESERARKEAEALVARAKREGDQVYAEGVIFYNAYVEWLERAKRAEAAFAEERAKREELLSKCITATGDAARYLLAAEVAEARVRELENKVAEAIQGREHNAQVAEMRQTRIQELEEKIVVLANIHG